MKTNKNGVKLLAAIMALAMVLVAGFVIIDDSNDVDATPISSQEDLTSNATINATETTTGQTLNFSAASSLGENDRVTVTVNMVVSSAGTNMVSGGSITVGDKVTLILNMTTESTTALAGCHILNNTDVTLNDSGQLILKQAANVQGISYVNSNSGWSPAVNLDMNNSSKLILDGANGISGVAANLSGTSSIEMKSTTSTNATLQFHGLTSVAGTKVSVTDPKVNVMLANAASSVGGDIDAKNSKVEVRNSTNSDYTTTITGKVDSASFEITKGGSSTGKSLISLTGNGSITADISINTIQEAADVFAGSNSPSEIVITGAQTVSDKIYIPANKTLVLDGCVVTGAGIIFVDGELVSDAAYIYVGVNIGENGTFTGRNTHINTVTGTMVNSYKVGFGDVLNISGTIPADVTVDAYGKLVLNDVTINGRLNTYVGSTVDVQGTVVVSSAFTIQAGAEMELTGTITVKNDLNGGATLALQTSQTINNYDGSNNITLDAKMTILEGGVLNINKPTSNSAAEVNALTVNTGAKMIVEGTLSITGTLNGKVLDKGTILFNGTGGTNAKIVVYDGVTLNVASVVGTLTVDDTGIVPDIDSTATDASKIADGNQIVLANVKGITITEEVTSKVNKNNNAKYYICNMDVTGSFTKVPNITNDATIGITAEKTGVTIDGSEYYGNIYLVDSVVIGKDVAVTIDGAVTLDGTMSSMDPLSAGTVTIARTGALTVNGSLYAIQGKITTTGTINAVKYQITTTTENYVQTVEYYTGFAQAVAAIADADDDTITVLGTVKMKESADIAAGMTLAVVGKLSIEKSATLTVVDGAYMSVSGTAAVKGTLTIINSDTGLTIGKLEYDTSKVNGKTVTYTNLANSLADAKEGDVITLAQNITVDGTVTVPEGVTVQTGKYSVTLKDNSTLKVDGTLAVQNGGTIAKAIDAGAWGEKAKVIVNGVLTSTSTIPYDGANGYKIAGAYFTLRNVNYVTNLAYAAENVEDGAVTIYGIVSAGDVEFVEKENGDLSITVTGAKTALSVSSIKLDGATITVLSSAIMTGDVIAASGDSDAKITFKKASQFTVESGTRDVGTEKVDCMYINGNTGDVNGSVVAAATKGAVTISEGTVYIRDVTDTAPDYSVSEQDNILTVASGATLVVTGTANFGAAPENKSTAVIEGTLDVVGNVNVTGIMEVSGTVNVAKDNRTGNATLVVYANSTPGKLIVTGSVIVSEDEDNNGTFEVGVDGTYSGYVIVGEKATQVGAAAEITGKVDLLKDSYIKVYDGASVENAKISWENDESTADNTVYYINDTVYMTVYVKSSNVSLLTPVVADYKVNVGLDITGIKTTGANDIAKWYTDATFITPVGTNDKVGTNNFVYFDAPASEATFKISVGSGMSLWIDGVKYLSGSTQNFTVGEHKIQVIINPGYKGTTSVEINGKAITSDKFTVTVDMVNEDENVITVTGDIAIDMGETPAPVEPTKKDDGMGITDYLLIILVVLAAILVVIVAIRMMRS